MNIFVLNCGSTTFKYQLINMDTEEILAKGLVERIGSDDVQLSYEGKGEKITKKLGYVGHKEGIDTVLDLLIHSKGAVLSSLDEISAVGHRIVHGGDRFTHSTLVSEGVLNDIKNCVSLAPLHNPANIIGIEVMQATIPNAPNAVIFDTAYHQTMPEESYRYAIPSSFYTKYKIRKYGFHGTSHQYVAKETAKLLDIPYDQFNTITCHLGGGCSVTAIQNGKSYDTSMGLTPLQGLIMATRSGDIDPAIIPFVLQNTDISIQAIDEILNKQSGLLALSELSMDLRDIEDAAAKGDEKSILAIDAFVHRVVHYIGGYAALLGRVDAIVFTAGIGENGIEIRELIAARLKIFGVEIDTEKNRVRGKSQIISSKDSKIPLVLMPTNEEWVIATDTLELIS